MFTVVDCGFVPRCALEVDDGSEVRIDKVCTLVGECRFSIHDLSRTELDPHSRLPRFNMPLELGIFIGAKRFGGRPHRRKTCLILDTEPYRYQAFISDIAGQDIRAHGGDERRLVAAIRDWLRIASRRATLPGGAEIFDRYGQFQTALPRICRRLRLKVDEMTFVDLLAAIAMWLDQRGTAA
ncbi:MAG TPA: hypothetical protein VEK73_09605 [Xanthobacteraceae bacterium]|nr:hypothetical protein [Xanthobacteraceae bacterium]